MLLPSCVLTTHHGPWQLGADTLLKGSLQHQLSLLMAGAAGAALSQYSKGLPCLAASPHSH